MNCDNDAQSALMCVMRPRFSCFVIVALSGLLLTAEAWAHRDRGPNDPCRRQLGDSLLHLTLYQPQFDPDAEYCEEVPRAGKTLMVVDVTAGELRQTPISLEVIAVEDSSQPLTILEVPPKVYERGAMDTEVNLKTGSDYVVRVMVKMSADNAPQALSFPIRVAAWYRALIMPALIVAALLALTAISVIRYYMSSRQDEFATEMKVRRVID
jgi:hypothetical protein